MNKKLMIVSIASFMLLGLIIASNASKNPKGLESNDVESPDSNVYLTTVLESDLAEAYKDYDALISNAEVVVFGTVKHVNSYMEDIRITSKFELEIDSVEKGDVNVNDTISVIMGGGRVTFSEYLNAYGPILEEKTSAKEVAEERKLHGNEYVESIWDGVPNVKKGDRLVLFLVKIEYSSDYSVLGGSYYGKLTYDKDSDQLYKEIIGDTSQISNGKYTTKKEMKIKRSDFNKKVKATKDKSKKNKEVRERLVWEMEDEEYIEGRDPSFDKYKE